MSPTDYGTIRDVGRSANSSSPPKQSISYRPKQNHAADLQESQALLSSINRPRSESPHMMESESSRPPLNGQYSIRGLESSFDDPSMPLEPPPTLQYFHQWDEPVRHKGTSHQRAKSSLGSNAALLASTNSRQGSPLGRPATANSLYSAMPARSRNASPQPTLNSHIRTPSATARSPDNRSPSSYDLLTAPYPQPSPAANNLNHQHLQTAVGNNASLLSTRKTLEMYRANVKKTNEPDIQYTFALLLIDAAKDTAIHNEEKDQDGTRSEASNADSQGSLLHEARQILQRLADRSYPFAQYYLADGYASGFFTSGKQDNDRAFPLFIAAAKHGHAEASYRAGLCYEFGWGTRTDPVRAAQYFRQAAAKNHPGAMLRLGRACMTGDLGLGKKYREGYNWLKRAADAADTQYNSAPYELALLHETGFGDDIFKDEGYAAQLLTQAADLGYSEASYRLGDAYEHGKLTCPRDPALSVHFYTGAAQQGHPLAMMALCAWYMIGAEPVLERDEYESYEWAKRAAEAGLPKAQYAVAYFTETGLGCRRDPLEANMWYVRAADAGDERAKHRLQAIRVAAAGGGVLPPQQLASRKSPSELKGKKSPLSWKGKSPEPRVEAPMEGKEKVEVNGVVQEQKKRWKLF